MYNRYRVIIKVSPPKETLKIISVYQLISQAVLGCMFKLGQRFPNWWVAKSF
jgi:hypothetical protein